MANAGQEAYGSDDGEIFNKHMFNLAVTIVHELVICFVGFLSGTEKPSAPPMDTGRPWGRWWQHYMFGGSIGIYSEPGHPLGALQPGTTWLIDEHGEIGRKINGIAEKKPGRGGKVSYPGLQEQAIELLLTPRTGYKIYIEHRSEMETADHLSRKYGTMHMVRRLMIRDRQKFKIPSSNTTKAEQSIPPFAPQPPTAPKTKTFTGGPPHKPAAPKHSTTQTKNTPPYVPHAPSAPETKWKRPSGDPSKKTSAPKSKTTQMTPPSYDSDVPRGRSKTDPRNERPTRARSRSKLAPPPVARTEAYSGRPSRYQSTDY